MAATQTSFDERIARIQARANGKEPKAPVLAPMVGEDLREPKERKRGLFSGFVGRLVMPLAVAGIAAGVYSGELIGLLPPEMVAEAASQPGAFGDFLRAQLSDEQLSRIVGHDSAAAPLPGLEPVIATN